MTIWSAEIKELENLYNSFKGQHPRLDKELERLIKTDDENIVLVYARRCLEVIITDLSERELKRPRGTEPLKGIIDKLNREEKVPHNIIVSMQNLNSLSTFGAHPKDFDPRQVKPVILDLTTVLEWYLTYMETQERVEEEPGAMLEKRIEQIVFKKAPPKPARRISMVAGILLAGAIIIISLIIFDIIGGGKQARVGAIESLVILPFGNYTGVDTLDPLVAGMHSFLINEIGKITGLRIISKVSSDSYKNSDKSIPQIAKELNVDAAIETGVLSFGDTICMQPRLMSGGREEKQLWIGDYRESKGNLFNLYNRIIKQIASEVKISLTPAEKAMLADSRIIDPEAIDAYMKGRNYLDQISPKSLPAAIESFEKAIDIEPDWAAPYAGLSEVAAYMKQMGFGSYSENVIMIYENLNKALELDPNSVESHYRKAGTAAWTEFDWKKAEKEFLKAIELNPSHVRSHSFYAHVLTILRRTDEALHHGKISVELDPENPLTLGLYAVVLNEAGKCKEALFYIEKALSIEPGHGFTSDQLWDTYECLGDYRRLFEIWKGMDYPLWEEYGVAELFEKVFQERGWIAVTEEAIRVYEEGWAKDGLMHVWSQAGRYVTVGKYDKAMDYFEIVYENNNHAPNLPYISAKSYYDKMKGNQRYLELLKKMNLPVE